MKIILFLAEDDPHGVREARIDQWSGRAIVIPRRAVAAAVKERDELNGPCLYFLVASTADRRFPRVYVGEADGFGDRMRNHDAKKDWWQTAVAFYSSDGSLTKASIQYLESVCLERLRAGGWCILENSIAPRLPTIPREDREGLERFARHVASLMPVLGFDIFAPPPAESADEPQEPHPIRTRLAGRTAPSTFDTIVCPAQADGFERAFLGERAWWAIRINEQNIPRIKYIAMYQVAPISAITHYGVVERIEEIKATGKYRVYLRGEPCKLARPVGMGRNRHLKPQGPKYALLAAIKKARTLDDVFGR